MSSRLTRIRALCVLLAVLIGWASMPASLAFGFSGGCRMACCTAARTEGGEEVEYCPAHKHRSGANQSESIQAEIGPPCASHCVAPSSTARFFPSGINREITRLINLSTSANPLSQELELIHHSLRFSPAPTRAPPPNFA